MNIRRLASVAAVAGLIAGSVIVWRNTITPADETARLNWYKGNLHTHSLWSDGNDYPEMIADWYKRQGYHFLALSDHNVLSQGERWIDVAQADRRGAIGGLQRYRERFGEWVETREMDGRTEVRLKPLGEFRKLFEEPEQFLFIQAEEITDRFESLPVHINAHNIDEAIRPRGGGSVRETIANNLRAVEEQSLRSGKPTLAHLNHPNYHFGVSAEDLAAVLEERFFEVYNGHPDVGHLGDHEHPSVERVWDIANTIRVGRMQAAPLYGVATDDSHNYFSDRGSTPGRGWVMVRAAALAPEALIEAMKQGDFYATSGVVLQDAGYQAGTKTIEIRIAPDGDATFTTQFIGTRRGAIAGQPTDDEAHDLAHHPQVGRVLAEVNGLTARYRLAGDELYVRAVVTSSQPPVNPSFAGQRQQAWTQPVGWQGQVGR